MEPKESIKKLIELYPTHEMVIWNKFNSGKYRVISATPPDEYDENCSSICWGWLASGPATDPIVATYARGERGNDDFDSSHAGLVIWIQGDAEAERNATIERAAKALISKEIGFGEFKQIIKANL